MHSRLGQSWEEFRQRPAREVEEYLTIIQLINREERIRAKSHRP